MSKIEKKKEKLNQRILNLENELKNTLQKKTNGKEININEFRTKINDLKKQILNM